MEKVLFIGAGRMATAIAIGMVKSGFDNSSIKAFDINEGACEKFSEASTIFATNENLEELISDSDVIFLAVKPQFLAGALGQLNDLLRSKLIISVVAGVTIEKLNSLTDSNRIVRVMPNTPALVSKACSGYTVSESVSNEEIIYVEKILNSVGMAINFPEKLIDSVTALSGSGPAYVFEFVDAIAEGGANCGIPMSVALDMAIATCEGAIELLKQTKLHPSILKDQVTSPGGTTMKALEILADNQFRQTIIKAVEGAFERSKELGRNA